MKAFAIAKKTIIELIREPQLLLVVIFFPAVLMCVYYLGFGQSDKGMAQFLKIQVINEDQGVINHDTGIIEKYSDGIIERLKAVKFDGKPVYTIMSAKDMSTAEIALMEQTNIALMVFPEDFSQKLFDKSMNAVAPIELKGDTQSLYFTFAKSFMDDVLRNYAAEIRGTEKYSSPIVSDFLSGTGKLTDFQFGVPGVAVFGILFLVITTATIVVREKVGGTLKRLLITKARSSDILSGISCTQIIVALIQVPIAFFCALLFGFKTPGSLALAILIGFILSFSAVGIGLIVASFSSSDGEAANFGAGVLLPMVFLSGTLFTIPALPIGKIYGRIVNLYDIFPSAHAAEAMRQVLVYGDGIGAISYRLIAMIILAVIYFSIGILFYRRMQMRI